MQDNAFAIWNSYAVRAWPTIVLIDKKGIIRYSPIGEGADEQAQSMIAKLLIEPRDANLLVETVRRR